MQNQVFKLLMLLACASLLRASYAQRFESGSPKSLFLTHHLQTEKMHFGSMPDYDAALAKPINSEEAEEFVHPIGKEILAIKSPINVEFPNSGTFTYLEDGSSIWRTAISIPSAKALNLFFDDFYLPMGVQVYVMSVNNRQIKGAYTSKNNHESRSFLHDAVIGDVIYLELNIDPEVNEKDIALHIQDVGVWFNGINLREEVQHVMSMQPVHKGRSFGNKEKLRDST
jgi:hypothetical protein